jgi:Type IV secretion system proteins
VLQALHDQIMASDNIKDTADLQARYQTEQAYVQDQVAQFQAVQQMYQIQKAVWQQQADEHDAQEVSGIIAEATALGY